MKGMLCMSQHTILLSQEYTIVYQKSLWYYHQYDVVLSIWIQQGNLSSQRK